MAIELTTKQKAAIADCGCPLPPGTKRVGLSKKAIIIPFAIFALVLLLLWAVWLPGVWWLVGIYGVLMICIATYRLIRGHTLRCAITWSPVAALYVIGDGIGSATP